MPPDAVFWKNPATTNLLYAASCDAALGREPRILRPQRPDYCGALHPLRLACLTHQLMAAQWSLETSGRCKNRCGDVAGDRALIAALQAKVVTQLA